MELLSFEYLCFWQGKIFHQSRFSAWRRNSFQSLALKKWLLTVVPRVIRLLAYASLGEESRDSGPRSTRQLEARLRATTWNVAIFVVLYNNWTLNQVKDLRHQRVR